MDLSVFDTNTLIVERNGQFIIDTENRLLQRGCSPAEIEAAKVKLAARKRKNAIRDDVKVVGDQMSMIGYISDGAMLALYGLAVLIKSINTRTTVEEIRLDLNTIQPIVDDFLTKIEAGELKLPPLVKGTEVVIPEILEKMNKVSEAFINN